MGDEGFVGSTLAMDMGNVEASKLDPKTHALVRLASLVASGASGVSYLGSVEAGLAAGATEDEIVGTLVAVAPTVGVAHVVDAAPKLALALGYDVDAALEGFGEPG